MTKSCRGLILLKIKLGFVGKHSSESHAVSHFPGVPMIGRILSGPNSFQGRGGTGGVLPVVGTGSLNLSCPVSIDCTSGKLSRRCDRLGQRADVCP